MIKLTKNSQVEINHEKFDVGLRWDAVGSGGLLGAIGGLFGGSSKKDIDLDASALLIADNSQVVDVVYFGNKRGRGVSLSGDNLTGEGDGDDETLFINTSELPPNVNCVVITVTSFRGQTFDEVNNVFCNIYDKSHGGNVIATYHLNKMEEGVGKSAFIMGMFTKTANGWTFKVIEQFAQSGRSNTSEMKSIVLEAVANNLK